MSPWVLHVYCERILKMFVVFNKCMFAFQAAQYLPPPRSLPLRVYVIQAEKAFPLLHRPMTFTDCELFCCHGYLRANLSHLFFFGYKIFSAWSFFRHKILSVILFSHNWYNGSNHISKTKTVLVKHFN